MRHITSNYLFKSCAVFVMAAFLSAVCFQTPGFAQATMVMPAPGTQVGLSGQYLPVSLAGLQIDHKNPFQINFLVNNGQEPLSADTAREEYLKLIKYFMASLTTPVKKQWVNLSPYESKRVIEDEFGLTEMGRDLLSQDYLLKQLTASLIYPEKALGKAFWKSVYEQVYAKYGATDVPVNTFNKVWIIPQTAAVYEEGDKVWLLESTMNVLLEKDYMALAKDQDKTGELTDNKEDSTIAGNITREIILPAIKKEINEGRNFALLRQMYSAMIFATWYKTALKGSILSRVYANAQKVQGIDLNDKTVNERIYQQYIEAFKKGAFNYIKEDVDPQTQAILPRKYFSGGVVIDALPSTLRRYNEAMSTPQELAFAQERLGRNVQTGSITVVTAGMVMPGAGRFDRAMSVKKRLTSWPVLIALAFAIPGTYRGYQYYQYMHEKNVASVQDQQTQAPVLTLQPKQDVNPQADIPVAAAPATQGEPAAPAPAVATPIVPIEQANAKARVASARRRAARAVIAAIRLDNQPEEKKENIPAGAPGVNDGGKKGNEPVKAVMDDVMNAADGLKGLPSDVISGQDQQNVQEAADKVRKTGGVLLSDAVQHPDLPSAAPPSSTAAPASTPSGTVGDNVGNPGRMRRFFGSLGKVVGFGKGKDPVNRQLRHEFDEEAVGVRANAEAAIQAAGPMVMDAGIPDLDAAPDLLKRAQEGLEKLKGMADQVEQAGDARAKRHVEEEVSRLGKFLAEAEKDVEAAVQAAAPRAGKVRAEDPGKKLRREFDAEAAGARVNAEAAIQAAGPMVMDAGIPNLDAAPDLLKRAQEALEKLQGMADQVEQTEDERTRQHVKKEVSGLGRLLKGAEKDVQDAEKAAAPKSGSVRVEDEGKRLFREFNTEVESVRMNAEAAIDDVGPMKEGAGIPNADAAPGHLQHAQEGLKKLNDMAGPVTQAGDAQTKKHVENGILEMKKLVASAEKAVRPATPERSTKGVAGVKNDKRNDFRAAMKGFSGAVQTAERAAGRNLKKAAKTAATAAAVVAEEVVSTNETMSEHKQLRGQADTLLRDVKVSTKSAKESFGRGDKEKAQEYLTAARNAFAALKGTGDLTSLVVNGKDRRINRYTRGYIKGEITQAGRRVSEAEQYLSGSDKAQLNGGIDFNAAPLNMQIKRDGSGMPLPMNLQDPAMLNVPGLAPVIMNIMPLPASELPRFSRLGTTAHNV